jgi:Fe(3+) dicitrate transport protein
MPGRNHLKFTALAVGVVGLWAAPAVAQTAAEPAGQSSLPQVDVIQKNQSAAKKKPVQASSPTPQPPPAQPDFAQEAPTLENSPYGAAASSGAAARAAEGPISPINAKRVLPDNLQDFSGAASRITTTDLDSQRPTTTHEALARVPGVVTVTDDGAARHSGIGLRGSPFRRSRKVLVMEDGVPINFSTYLDSSTHYTPPLERIESIEVMRGPIVNYGPLNNHGVINFRNLSPFGANETVIKAGIGTTEGSDRDINNFRHVHTRQNLGNVGVVASYSGADTGGAWDVEDLGYNDFYGALGFRGTNQDLTISGGSSASATPMTRTTSADRRRISSASVATRQQALQPATSKPRAATISAAIMPISIASRSRTTITSTRTPASRRASMETTMGAPASTTAKTPLAIRAMIS